MQVEWNLGAGREPGRELVLVYTAAAQPGRRPHVKGLGAQVPTEGTCAAFRGVPGGGG